MLNIEIKGLESLLNRLENLEDGIEKACENAVKSITKKTQAQAKLLSPVHLGELRESIKTRFQTEDGQIIGEVFTNKNYAPYVEFGTGPKGQDSAPQLPEGIQIHYSQSGWLIPASAMGVDQASMYGFCIIKDKSGNVIGYATNGQKAQPYMVPAMKYAEQIASDEMEQAIRNLIGGKV